MAQIDKKKTPSHVAIIMDGNGRWAKKQGHERLYGHNFGVESVREVLKASTNLSIKYLTLYAFSTENWNRPKDEVDGLMDLLVKSIANEIDELMTSDVRLLTIGDIDGLPASCQAELKSAMAKTEKNKTINLVLALNYSSRWEMTNALKQISKKVSSGEINETDINDQLISDYLTTKGIPDPELIIRTSGEHRLSNFLLWQAAYSEFYFCNVLWPDFKGKDLYKAVLDFQSRERRFGLVSEQLT